MKNTPVGCVRALSVWLVVLKKAVGLWGKWLVEGRVICAYLLITVFPNCICSVTCWLPDAAALPSLPSIMPFPLGQNDPLTPTVTQK